MNLEQMAAYIAAFIDGEGHIGCHKTARGFYTRIISFSNTERCLIDRMVYFLKELGFNCAVHLNKPRQRLGGKTQWIVYLAGGRAAFVKFRSIVPLQSARKKIALDKIVDESYADPEVANAKRRRGAMVVCRCGKEFYAPKAISDRGEGRSCSYECAGLAKRRRETRICDRCGGSFEAKPSTSKRFCSIKCRTNAAAPRMAQMAASAAAARWDNQ